MPPWLLEQELVLGAPLGQFFCQPPRRTAASRPRASASHRTLRTASSARLVKKQLLNQNHELDGRLRFDQRQWLVSTVLGPPPFPVPGTELAVITVETSTSPPANAAVLVTNFLHGLIRAAVSKG